MTNSSSLFTPRFSSGLQDLHFLNRKCLIHPICLSWSLLSLSPPFFFSFPSFIFTLRAHTHIHTSQIMARRTQPQPEYAYVQTQTKKIVTRLHLSPLGSRLAVPSPVSQSSQCGILLIQTAVTAASALCVCVCVCVWDTTQSHTDIMLWGGCVHMCLSMHPWFRLSHF